MNQRSDFPWDASLSVASVCSAHILETSVAPRTVSLLFCRWFVVGLLFVCGCVCGWFVVGLLLFVVGCCWFVVGLLVCCCSLLVVVGLLLVVVVGCCWLFVRVFVCSFVCLLVGLLACLCVCLFVCFFVCFRCPAVWSREARQNTVQVPSASCASPD